MITQLRSRTWKPVKKADQWESQPEAGSGSLDLTQVEPHAPPPDPTPTRVAQSFNDGEHRARTAGRAVYALLVLVAVIIVGSFVALDRGIEADAIEQIDLILLAVVGVVAGPVLAYFFRT